MPYAASSTMERCCKGLNGIKSGQGKERLEGKYRDAESRARIGSQTGDDVDRPITVQGLSQSTNESTVASESVANPFALSVLSPMRLLILTLEYFTSVSAHESHHAPCEARLRCGNVVHD